MKTRTEAERIAIADVALIVGLAAAYVVAEVCGVAKRWTLIGVVTALAFYIVLVRRRGTERWRDFGLRADNLAAAARPVARFTLAAAAVIVAGAVVAGRRIWNDELAVLLPLYPIYGVAQQLVFQGVLHRRLALLLERRTAIVLTAAIFAGVHAGNTMLVAVTFAAGLGWSLLFARVPNVWMLGLSHGLLAALAYPLLLGDAPLARF